MDLQNHIPRDGSSMGFNFVEDVLHFEGAVPFEQGMEKRYC